LTLGGIGKTILARALCHDKTIQAAFPDGVLWVEIGQHPRDLTIQLREIVGVLGGSLEKCSSEGSCNTELQRILQEKAVLLVLDDVWSARHVEPFRTNSPQCRLLFTTRDACSCAALGARTQPLEILSREQALELLARWSQRPAENRGFPATAVDVVYI
jgi:hypothetical protein